MNRHHIAAVLAISAFVSCSGTSPEAPAPDPGGNGTPETPAQVADTTKRIDESFSIFLGGKGATFGNEGRICVYSSKDDKLVDYVDMADMASVEVREDGQFVPKTQMVSGTTVYNTMMDAIGPNSYKRIVHCTPIRIVDDSLVFKPHSHKLEYDKEYYITADASIVSGTSFKGVAKGAVTFRTCKTPTAQDEIIVAKTGKADFRTVQAAIDYASSLSQSKTRNIIISNGTYLEPLYIRSNNNLTLKAASGHHPEISYANCEAWVNGTGGNVSAVPSIGGTVSKVGGRPVILIESCDMVSFIGLILRNSFGSTNGQAEVIYNNDNSGKCRMIIRDCELWSYQDTFLTKGYAWVYNSLIAGHCDYIWGYPKTCLFENCEIRSLAKGYIVQCRCAAETDKGFVFIGCRLTAGTGVADGSMTLARSAGKSDSFDNVSYINCTMSPVISTAGWHTSPAPNPSKASATAGWREYGSLDASGKALSLSGRASCARVLSAEEASALSTRSAVFSGAPFSDNGWLNE